MRHLSSVFLLCAVSLWFPHAGQAADFSPDPRSVQSYGPAYRYPQAGWIVMHIEGEPYERGVQHGQLLAAEIAAHVRCLAACAGPKAPAEAWKHVRNLVNSLFLRRYDREQLEEMKGIAEGASAAGATFDGRPIDLIDIVALNAPNELESLESALEATPTGLEGMAEPKASAAAVSRPHASIPADALHRLRRRRSRHPRRQDRLRSRHDVGVVSRKFLQCVARP